MPVDVLSQRLPWVITVNGQIVARFATERDARGFAQARYKAEALVLFGRTHQDLAVSAVRAGARTSLEVAAFTGLPGRHAAAYLCAALEQGVLRKAGTVPTDRPGRDYVEYEAPA